MEKNRFLIQMLHYKEVLLVKLYLIALYLDSQVLHQVDFKGNSLVGETELRDF